MPSYQTLKRVAEERKKQADLLRVKTKKNSILLVLMSAVAFVGLALILYVWFQFGVPLRASGESLVLPKTVLYAIILYAVYLLAFAALLIYHKQNSNQIMTGVDELASIDSLTGCHKFLKFQVHAEELLASLKEKPWFFLYFDIKNFKYINDAYGYSVGDETLIHIADSMRKVAGQEALISRVNGDSFVLLKPYSSDAELDAFFQTLTAEIDKAPVCLRHKYRMYLSAGVYVVSSNEEGLSVAAMVDRAIIARDTVKHLSGTRYAIYTEKLREQIHYEKELEQEMVSALANGEFEIYFQPKCDIQKGDTIVGAETLVRWNSSKKGMLPPSSFIPLMEKNGFIVEVDLFVFELVCSYLRERLNRRLPVVPISVNVSGIDMFQSNFVSLYTEVKRKYDIPDGLLQLEFTESIAYDDHERFSDIIKELNANGFDCSLDDFGKGNSSLNVIKDLPVSVLKLDMMFFRKSEFRERAEAVITSIVSMAKALGMKTVAEGVESRDQVEFLRKIGCDVVQGYVFAKPMPAHKMNEYIDVLPKQEALRSPDVDLSVSLHSLWGNAPCKAEYQAVLNFVDAVVTEIDLDHGTFHVVSNPSSKGAPASPRESYDESMRRTAQQRIHPEDREEWLNRFSTNGLRTAFFRGEDRISFKYRALDESDKEYNWFEMTVLRLASGEQKSSRALSFLQNVHFRKWLDGNGGISQVRLAEAVLALYRSVYELDLVTLRVKQLEVIRQAEGYSASYRELIDHVATLLHDDDRASYLEQLAPGALRTAFQGGMGAVYLEYRMRVKNEYRWFSVTVLPADNVPQGRPRAMFFVKDIHDRKAKDLERYRKVNHLKEAIISTFEEMALVNLSLDELEEIRKDNQIPSGIVKTYSQHIMRFAESRIHPDDRERILSTFSREALIQSMIKEGIPERIERCRVKDAEGNYHWMRFYAIAEPESTPESFQIYLYSKNIDRIMREMEILQKKADRDSLTGLYNRGIFEKMVRDCLKKTGKGKLHAFLIIDVDDFKKINDQWGHMAGDETLMTLSEKIQSNFRTEDLVGRIGGDEFVVFMKDIPSAESARKKASELCRLFCGPLRSEMYEGIVTCSIGGALYGADSTTYEELFRNADDALYKAKAKGKNCAYFNS